ncbi:MAG: hypothetical protein K8F25_19700, partial [Fimbriimonadaceae bacterium]|nr:hypothetical protein [Alphaproteobacteria bacterium]
MAQKKRSRFYLTVGTAAVIGMAIAFAFWPRPLMVDIGEVVRKPMVVTIDEEGRTRVREAYVVSTPMAGELLRVEARAGDRVIAGETVVARMLPANPSLLDIRTREQARATVTAAEAALRVARANLNKAIADKDLAFSNLERTRFLFSSNTVSIAALDRMKNEARAAEAAVEAAEASISMRSAEVENARALLINFEDRQLPAA